MTKAKKTTRDQAITALNEIGFQVVVSDTAGYADVSRIEAEIEIEPGERMIVLRVRTIRNDYLMSYAKVMRAAWAAGRKNTN